MLTLAAARERSRLNLKSSFNRCHCFSFYLRYSIFEEDVTPAVDAAEIHVSNVEEIDRCQKVVSYDHEKRHIRMRRKQSVARTEEITKEAEKTRKSQADKQCHRLRDSLFSWSSEFRDFTGFVNWGFLLLMMGGLRHTLENVWHSYRSIPMAHRTQRWDVIIITLLKMNENIKWKQALILHVINLTLIILILIIFSWTLRDKLGLIGNSAVCSIYTITFLKLWSYIRVNHWCRRDIDGAHLSKTRRRAFSVTNETENGVHSGDRVDEVVQYPASLTIRDFYYFMVVPSLCYELNFPRTSRIRKRFLLKGILEVLIGAQVVMGLFQQWLIPSVKNSLVTFSKMEPLPATERLLKLAIPNYLFWLVWFVLCFHSYFNMLGELLCFANRYFYGDWWNATNIDVFWRSWNLPIHRWAVRHLYMPLIEIGWGEMIASVSVFFHEYLVNVPLRMFNLWTFSWHDAPVRYHFQWCRHSSRNDSAPASATF